MKSDPHRPWYEHGLAFGCRECGACCSGPEEGYVWISRAEIDTLAAFLEIDVETCLRRYCRRVGVRYSLVEQPRSKDCVFLEPDGRGGKQCAVYPVRPLQCRTWPFWTQNLRSRNAWRDAAAGCPGIDQGRWHSLERIETIAAGRLDEAPPAQEIWPAALDWLAAHRGDRQVLDELIDLYTELDRHLAGAGPTCDNCGSCCDFQRFGHRLYVTTLEMLVFVDSLDRDGGPWPEPQALRPGRCPYQDAQGCTARSARPVGCRIFYCRDLPAAFQGELTEQALERLRQLHDDFRAVYCYADLLTWLEQLGRARARFAR